MKYDIFWNKIKIHIICAREACIDTFEVCATMCVIVKSILISFEMNDEKEGRKDRDRCVFFFILPIEMFRPIKLLNIEFKWLKNEF